MDPGLHGEIGSTANHVTSTLKDGIHDSSQSNDTAHSETQDGGPRDAWRKELRDDEEEEEVGFYQPKRWWFTSTAFPLIAGTFGPLANLFSICALVQTWRTYIPQGGTEAHGQSVPDPHWLLAVNSISFGLAIIANLFLLFNFAHRVRYSVAQPMTITLWYLSAILLIVPLSLTSRLKLYPSVSYAFAESYYYAIISAALYAVISTLLVSNYVGAHVFHAYPASFNSLTVPQRTLMLQTISYVFYLALGAGVFSSLEGWSFVDGVYWADYTLLTIGLGTDFPLTTNAGKGLLIPYAVGGITMLGLVIGSVRGLVLERGKTKVIRRTLEKERERWFARMETPDDAWKRAEFDAMRSIEARAARTRRWWSLLTSFLAFLAVWLGGALVFRFSEAQQSWTYFDALYFAYTTLLTVGYGDFYPQSSAGKPFFVIWSLLAVPTVTVLISNMGDTVVGWVRDGTLWLGQRTILPEGDDWGVLRSLGLSRRDRAARAEADAESGGDRGEKGLGRDVGRLGSAVEEAEGRGGHPGSLEARLAREIRRVARDVGKEPAPRYEWDEWVRWLELLGEREGGKEGAGMGRRGRMRKGHEEGDGEQEAEWTWLGDGGPLFSTVSETEWLLGRLCERLEEAFVMRFEGEREECSSSSP